jgi:hypothetical protein
MAVYFFAMYLMGASLGPVGTGALSDALAARAAAAAGHAVIDDRSRAVGLQQALYVVPALCALLSAVLYAASRALRADRQTLRDWMSLESKELQTSA